MIQKCGKRLYATVQLQMKLMYVEREKRLSVLFCPCLYGHLYEAKGIP